MVYCIKFMQTWLQLFSTIFHIDLLSHSTQSINIYYYIKSCIHGHNYFFNNFPTSVVKERICESETSELSLLYLHHKIYYNKTSSRWSLINKNSQNFFWESSFISYILWALRRHLPSNWSLTKQFLEYLASSKLVWFHPKVCIVWFIIIILYVFYLPFSQKLL